MLSMKITSMSGLWMKMSKQAMLKLLSYKYKYSNYEL